MKEIPVTGRKRTTLEDTFIVFMAACGVALKPVVGPMAKLVGSALFIPSGALAGMIYMLWPLLALLVTRKFGTATAVGLLEGIIVLITGFYGSHGILTLITYAVPCIIMDIVFVLTARGRITWLLMLPPAFANAAGSLLVGWMIMHMPLIPLLISLVPSFIAGGAAGLLAAALYRGLVKNFPQLSFTDSTKQENV